MPERAERCPYVSLRWEAGSLCLLIHKLFEYSPKWISNDKQADIFFICIVQNFIALSFDSIPIS